jgi:multidrug resistance efflux pump
VGAWIFIWKDYTVKEQQYHLITATSSHITALLQSLIKSQPFWLGKFIRNLGSYMRQARYVAAVLSVFAFILLLRMPYTHSIESPCELVPVVRHSVAAPFDGVLQKTFYEPGDLVKQGQVMAVLDDREIRLELTSGKEALATTRKKMDLHFAEEQMAEYQMATLEANKIEQRIKLLQYRLENLNIKAPKSGILLQGDLERAIGITVKTGQVLFEVAPLEKLYVQIAIAEEDISYIKLELPGKLHINSYPDNQWDLKVSYISPISQAQENNNVFVCEAIIDNSDGNLLSGMKGNVKLDAGKRPLWWVFFHKPIEWLRAKMWW